MFRNVWWGYIKEFFRRKKTKKSSRRGNQFYLPRKKQEPAEWRRWNRSAKSDLNATVKRENNSLVRLNKTRKISRPRSLSSAMGKRKIWIFLPHKIPSFRAQIPLRHTCNLSFAPNLELLFFFSLLNWTKEHIWIWKTIFFSFPYLIGLRKNGGGDKKKLIDLIRQQRARVAQPYPSLCNVSSTILFWC